MDGTGGRFLAIGSTNVVVLQGFVVCVPVAALVIHFRAALAAVEPVSYTHLVNVRTYLNLRTGPGTDYTVIGRLLNGAEVKVLEESNGWYKVCLLYTSNQNRGITI